MQVMQKRRLRMKVRLITMFDKGILWKDQDIELRLLYTEATSW